ncbi:hypothetical protein [Ruegeria faecimaris]|uniref:hypothetical protein n=1 Tax=Ruegeria faecimaris TaxID=686389 RepID=UPI0024912085|nr:hypothetical protein [Ruegeria faecimaris]
MSYPFHSGGIRLPGASRSDRKTQVGSTQHFTGGGVFGDGFGVRVGTESNLEKKALLLLSARPTTLDVVEQVAFEWYDEHGEYHTHYMDLVAKQTDDRVVGYAVRPSPRAGRKYTLKLARIKQQAIRGGVVNDFRLFTEQDVCPVELFNAELFHAVRRPDCFADPVMQDVAGASVGVTTIGALVDESGLDGMGFRAAVRLIKSGHLQMVRYERIERSSEVFRTLTI